MSPQFEKVEQFKIGEDEWQLHSKRLEQFFLANGIRDDRKKGCMYF